MAVTTSKIAAGLSILVGAAVLLGWILEVPVLKSVLPGLVTMKANTALAFLLAGVSLWLWHGEPGRRRRYPVALGCAGLVILTGLLTFCQYIFSWNLGIDQLLFREPAGAVGTSHPGRMAPTSALSFLLMGSALTALWVRRGRILIDLVALTVGIISLLALIGYGYDVEVLYGLSSFTRMAMHTAVLFVVFSVGVLFARPDHGLMAVVTSNHAGGILSRRLLPVVIGVPILIGWVRLLGQHAGWYDTEFGVSLSVLSSIVLLGAIVLVNARVIDRKEITRKQVEEERDRFFNLSMDMLSIAGFDGYFKHVNPAWEKTLGWSLEELLSRPYMDFIHPDDRQATRFEADKAHGGAPVTHFENRYLCKDGSYRWLQWKAIPVQEIERTFAIARDVTDQKVVEENIRRLNGELAAANRELESFSYSVSHDLRAPLRAIDGFSRVLLEEYAQRLDDEGKRLVKIIRENTQRMGELIDDLLDFSRMGRKELMREQINMEDLARSIVEELRAGASGRILTVNLAPLPPAACDRAMIRQVWVNLISNAIKFTRPSETARIDIGSTVENGGPVYYVKDNGVGFDMNYAHKLFGVFQRLHGSDEFEGTGVGLAIVQRVVHRHGGDVRAEGHVNEGATFYFSLGGAHD